MLFTNLEFLKANSLDNHQNSAINDILKKLGEMQQQSSKLDDILILFSKSGILDDR